MSHESQTAAPVCYRHPDRHTLLSCSRCGRPICASCSVDAAVGQRCPVCVKEEGTQKVIPARTSIPATADAPVTKGLIAIAVVFYLLSRFSGVGGDLVGALAQINREVAAGDWWRLITPVLLHASVTHILFNMWALWVLGPQVEKGVGPGPFLSLYLASAAAGGAFAFHLGDIRDLAVGASGAIFGLFGIWLSWALHRRHTGYGQAILSQLGFLLLINAAIPLMFPSVSWQAHLGGLIAGFAISELWTRIPRASETWVRIGLAASVGVVAIVSVLI